MKEALDKVYHFITKLLLLLEIELEELENNPQYNKINTKKNITDTLNKLITLIQQVNKIQKEMSQNDMASDVSGEDQKIIEQFLDANSN